MSISRIKQIKNIIADYDVRDPRATLIAIEKVLQEQPKASSRKPVIKITAYEQDERLDVTLVTKKLVTQPQINGVITALRKHRDVMFGPGTEKMDLFELFKHLEGDALNQRQIKKEGVK